MVVVNVVSYLVFFTLWIPIDVTLSIHTLRESHLITSQCQVLTWKADQGGSWHG